MDVAQKHLDALGHPLVHAALEEHLPKGDGPDLQHDDAPPDVADGLIPVHGEDEPAGFAVPADGHEEGGSAHEHGDHRGCHHPRFLFQPERGKNLRPGAPERQRDHHDPDGGVLVGRDRAKGLNLLLEVVFRHGKAFPGLAHGEQERRDGETGEQGDENQGHTEGRPFPERDVVPEDGRHDGDDHDIRRASEGRSHAAEGRCDGRERAQGTHHVVVGREVAGLPDGYSNGNEQDGQGDVGGYGRHDARPESEDEDHTDGVAPDEGQVEAPVGIALDQVAFLPDAHDDGRAEDQHHSRMPDGGENLVRGHDAEETEDRNGHERGDRQRQDFRHPPEHEPGAPGEADHAVGVHPLKRGKVFQREAEKRAKGEEGDLPTECGSGWGGHGGSKGMIAEGREGSARGRLLPCGERRRGVPRFFGASGKPAGGWGASGRRPHRLQGPR